MGTSQGGQRSGVRGQGGPTCEMYGELSLDFGMPTARREAVLGGGGAQRFRSFMSNRRPIVYHRHLLRLSQTT